MKRTNLSLSILLLALSLLTLAQEEKLDLAMIEKIKKEGLQNSKVMEIAFQLTDVSGPRLMNSAGYYRAANYAKNQMAQWGLINASLDPFGEFGKGWDLNRSYVAMIAPYYKPLIALPRAWSSGTKGSKTADVLLISAKVITELEKYRGKLGDKVLIIEENVIYKQTFKADATRYTADELQKMEAARPSERSNARSRIAAAPRRQETIARARAVTVSSLLKEMATKEGAVAVLACHPEGHDGTIVVGGFGGFKKTDPVNIPDIMLTLEDYMTTVRLLKAKVPVKMELDIRTNFDTKDLQGHNVIAEIKGTDPKLSDEVVMIGGHLDSWHGSTGATDNAAGVAVVMEAIRILKSLRVQPRRTIRIALWGGEEQGLLGSNGYVNKTFVDQANLKFLPAHEKLSAYYNLDNGTGKIRGIYLQGNEALRPIFTRWFEPFADIGAKTITIKSTGGTDHTSFVRVGLPGFQFIQDPIEYYTRTHHSNMDSYDHLVADDLKSSAVIIASIVYHTAMRDEKLPRN